MKTKQILYGLLTVLLFASCAGDPLLEITPSKSNSASAVKIAKVDVYVDCSGSMKGYVVHYPKDVEKAKQDFKTVVPKLITNIEQEVGVKNLAILKVKDNNYEKENSPHDFYTNLTTGNIFGGATTELNEIITHIIGNTKDKLSILVTDGVLSFGPKKLREEGVMYNISNKDILKSHLHQALARDTSVSVAIVKYLSDFNGRYYYTCKETVPYDGTLLNNRPYYVFVIGKKDVVSAFLTTKNLLPQSEGVFTVTNPVELDVALFKKKLEKEKGKLNSLLKVKIQINNNTKDTTTLYTTSYEKRKNKVFIVGIKKSNVPPACYIDEKIFFNELKCDNQNVTIEKLNSSNGKDGIDQEVKDQKRAQDYDYFYKITLDQELFANKLEDKELVFYFEPSLNVAASHTDKDYDWGGNLKALEHKTWGFNLITDAIKAANPDKQPQGAKFTLTLNRRMK